MCESGSSAFSTIEDWSCEVAACFMALLFLSNESTESVFVASVVAWRACLGGVMSGISAAS